MALDAMRMYTVSVPFTTSIAVRRRFQSQPPFALCAASMSSARSGDPMEAVAVNVPAMRNKRAAVRLTSIRKLAGA